MDSTAIDSVTLGVFLLPFVLWVIWELVLVLYLRPKAGREGTRRPQTISMVARGLGYRLAGLVYLWSGLGVHFWLNREAWGAVWTGVVFWLVPVLLLVYGALTWREPIETWPRWRRAAMHPLLWYPLGALGGYFLFPQARPF